MASTTAASDSRAVPSSIDSPRAKLVYVYLQREREVSIDALAAALDIRKIGLFTVLQTLESKNLVERDGVQTVKLAS